MRISPFSSMCALFLVNASLASAQVVLSNFSDWTSDFSDSIGSIGSSVTQNSSFITINSTGDGHIKGYFASAQDFSSFTTLSITGRVEASNALPSFSISFEDSSFNEAAVIVPTSLFDTTFSTVQIPLVLGGVDLTSIGGWGIVGSAVPGLAFQFSFDEVSLVPEPSTYAALFGLAALAIVGYCRFRTSPAS